MGKEKGLENLKKGVKFGSGQDPTKGGRKVSRINEVWSIVTGGDANEQIIELSVEDKLKLREKLLDCSIETLEKIAENPNTPVFIVMDINAMFGDIENQSLLNSKEIWSRIAPKTTKTEITGENGQPFAAMVNVILQTPSEKLPNSESEMRKQNGFE